MMLRKRKTLNEARAKTKVCEKLPNISGRLAGLCPRRHIWTPTLTKANRKELFQSYLRCGETFRPGPW